MESRADKIYQFLAQLRPSGTSPDLLFSPRAGSQPILKLLYVVNLDNKDRKFSIYFDNNGTSTTEAEAIAFEAVIKKNTTEAIEIDIPMRNSAGSFHVQTDKANELNFQLFGNK